MKAVRLIPAAALAACIVLTACSDYVGKEATHPLYAKYTTAKSAKSYREAAESLEEFLTICPKSPKAHYDAAMLYKENLEYYPAAIYHLQKYLDLSGETLSQQDKAAIRRYIQDCERMMFETYRVSNDIKLAGDVPQVDPAKLAAKNAENAALREKIQKYIENEKVILAQNQELRNRLDRLTSTAATTTKPAQSGSAASSASTASSTRGVPSSTTGTPGTTVAGENGVRYYYVAKGDGLQAIAQKMYGKASMWKVIQDANKEALGERGILKIGQRLVIPAVQQ
ncbi:MAG: LysM peptidoglycan-binding domain-containing protein [Lentisphaeria bacterium]|nr:LysM peptidoglycan-binding domain-containing protein [Lentisphaeria bacterium]